MSSRRPASLRFALVVLAVMLLLLQVRLWVSDDGFSAVSRMQQKVAEQREENAVLAERNQQLSAEVLDLKKGFSALEERARSDLGLVGPNETFYIISNAQLGESGQKP